MKTMGTLEISRIDYQNEASNGRFYSLPSLNDLYQITDMNEVHQIRISFDTHEDAIAFASKFPKSYKAKVNKIWHSGTYEKGQFNPFCTFSVSFLFNTFFHNDVTGSVNESAVKNREKVIAKLKALI